MTEMPTPVPTVPPARAAGDDVLSEDDLELVVGGLERPFVPVEEVAEE